MNQDVSCPSEPIILQMKIDKDLLTCQICYEYLDFPIMQCSSGPHFICHQCIGRVKKCQICGIGRFLNNRMLGEQLGAYTSTCRIDGCEKVCLPWTRDSHELECCFRVYPCFLCGILVSLSGVREHYSEHCSCVYIDANAAAPASGQSLSQFTCSTSQRRTFAVPLKDGQSVCVQSGDFFVLCRPNEGEAVHRFWLVTAFHKIPRSYAVGATDPSVELEVIDRTRRFPSCLSIMLQPFENMKNLCEKFACLVPVISSDMHLRCTLRQNIRNNCKFWMSPVTGFHHDHETDNLSEDLEVMMAD